MKLSIVIPVYNEARTIRTLLSSVENFDLPEAEKEIIIVDDGSTDGTRDILREYNRHVVLLHEKNSGKGAAIRTGLQKATGEYVVIQDADLEYDPRDIRKMFLHMRANGLKVLYGSRRLGDNQRGRAVYFAGGVFLSWLANILYGQSITDEATCYKMFRTSLLKSFPLKCERFEFCPEVTALTALSGTRIQEIGISYRPRDRSEGKKIRWQDGIEAVAVLLKYRILGRRAFKKT